MDGRSLERTDEAVLRSTSSRDADWAVHSLGDVSGVMDVGWTGDVRSWADCPPPAAPAAVVTGSRRATGYAMLLAEQSGAAIAEAGRTLVTTASLGCSLAAARAALAAGGDVVVVTAASTEAEPWPAEAADVWSAARGLISVSDSAHAHRDDFQRRDRFLNDLALPLVICECKFPSGVSALADNHRGTVFAYPHPIDSPGAPTNTLVKAGCATMLCGIDDLVRELDLDPWTRHRERE